MLPKLDGLQFRSNIAWIYSKVDLEVILQVKIIVKEYCKASLLYLINLALNYQLKNLAWILVYYTMPLEEEYGWLDQMDIKIPMSPQGIY